MKKTIFIQTLFICSFLSIQLLGQSNYSSNQLIVKFKEGISVETINQVWNDLQITPKENRAILGYHLAEIEEFPIYIQKAGRTTETLNNILDIVEHATNRAEVDEVGLNYQLTVPGEEDLITVNPLSNYDPISNCPNFPSNLLISSNPLNRVKIGIIDTGVNSDKNPDLFAPFLADRDNFIPNHSGADPTNGHGTKVGGIIAGMLTSSNIQASLYDLEAFDANGQADLFSIIKAIEYCIENHINIINISAGYIPNVKDSYTHILYNTLQSASKKGIILIVSAGNNSMDLEQQNYFPSSFEGIKNLISVASTDCNGDLSHFSNYGSNSIDLAAPGEEIYAPNIDGNYSYVSGSSFAAPIVTGIVAQLFNLYGPKDADYILCELENSVVPIPSLQNKVRLGGVSNIQYEANNSCFPSVTIPENPGNLTAIRKPFDFVAYPNPFKNELNINVAATEPGVGDIKIFNLLGQKIYEKRIGYPKGKASINLADVTSNWKKGTYIIYFQSKEHNESLKIIKN